MLNQLFIFFLYSYITITIAYTKGLGFDHEQTPNSSIKHDASDPK